MNVSDLIQTAEKSRLEGNLQHAYDLLIPLQKSEFNNSRVQLEIGLTLDAMNQEQGAIPYYKKALSLGLPPEQRAVALLCLGSSLRNVGQLEQSKHILKSAIDEFPNHIGLRCFYSLTQYNAGEPNESVRTLMHTILLLSPESVKPFARGLQYYANELK